ncbi:RNA polymerase sigma factor SigF [Streptomyces sp. NPDC059009]|uniref:RNA polymerase sigma factor SigF n=1 Tax=Streptomyces sp. NPDC059009 TaxID=3346694 RepID=UPI0036907302
MRSDVSPASFRKTSARTCSKSVSKPGPRPSGNSATHSATKPSAPPAHPSRKPSTRPARSASKRHPHDDAPDTAADFRRLVGLPEGPERDELRDELVRVWLPMADRLAGRFRGRGESFDDLRQVAALGLVKAVDRYDPRRGSAFESFAVPTITGEIKRHFRDHMWTLHVPRRVQDLRNRVRFARHDLAHTISGRAPTLAEIAEQAQMSEEDAATGLEALDSFTALSLDAELPGSEDGYALRDALGGPDPALDVVVDRVAVTPRLRQLPQRERDILFLRFFHDMTQSRIAERFGISQMHVSRLISRSCEQLREQVMRDAA